MLCILGNELGPGSPVFERLQHRLSSTHSPRTSKSFYNTLHTSLRLVTSRYCFWLVKLWSQLVISFCLSHAVLRNTPPTSLCGICIIINTYLSTLHHHMNTYLIQLSSSLIMEKVIHDVIYTYIICLHEMNTDKSLHQQNRSPS